MSGFVKNMKLYHVISFLSGWVYYQVRPSFYSFADLFYFAIFKTTKAMQNNEILHYSVSFMAGLVDGILPAVFVIGILHYVLAPRSRLFFIALSIGFVIFYSYNLYQWYEWNTADGYMNDNNFVALIIKPFGALLALWIVSGLYLKYIVKVVPETVEINDNRSDI